MEQKEPTSLLAPYSLLLTTIYSPLTKVSMGTWDTSIFGNDAAADWVAAFAGHASLQFIESTLDLTIVESAEYLDSEFACQGLAAAETLARAKTKTGEDVPYTKAVDEWARSFNGTIPHELINKAAVVTDLVLAENSELNDLWMESEGSYDVWRSGVVHLKERLLSEEDDPGSFV